MSQSIPIVVSFVSFSNCFVNLPPSFSSYLYDQKQLLPQNVILELSWNNSNNKIYVGWSGNSTNNQYSTETIEIDTQFGKANGLHEGQKISMKFCEMGPEAITVNVEPCSVDDWEIIVADYIENIFNQQLRVVFPNEKVVLWVNSNLIQFKIVEIYPKSDFARLGSNVEIIVSPKPRKSLNEDLKHSETKDITSTGVINSHVVYCLRLLPAEILSNDLLLQSKNNNNFCSVYVHPKDFQFIGLSSNLKVAKISKVPAPHNNKDPEEKTENGEKINMSDSLYVKVLENPNVVIGHVVMSESIMDSIDAEKFDIIRFIPLQSEPSQVSNIRIHFISRHSSSTAVPEKISFPEALMKSFEESTKIVLTNGMKLFLSPVRDEMNVLISFDTKDISNVHDVRHGIIDSIDAYTILTKNQLLDIKIEIGENVSIPDHKLLKHSGHLPQLAGVDKLIQRLQDYLIYCLGKVSIRDSLNVPGLGGLLLCGGRGSGKTCIAKTVASNLQYNLDTLAYCSVIKCIELSEDRISSVRDKLQQYFDDAAWHTPSILLFDDLDKLIPAEVEHVDSFRFRQLAECFFHVASKMLKKHRITILATAQQSSSIHSFLTTSHLFSEIAQLNPPTKTERCEILKAIMSSGPELVKKSISNIDLLSVASECEGYLAADLKALVERAIHESASRHLIENKDESKFSFKQEDFIKAQKDFIPFSLRGVKLHTSDVNWSDIGGLEETRKILMETLEWPIKYAPIFANCPLRLRSGLLLYGFPGCGKTLLASAVAKECGLNFISVKGPELLNKYIGASEASIRDLFERAQAAKPCVLFFDEFDSIAPKSTGVTDRVVNQMLTQMDGAEGLDGVYVLAATSRPDLIDPALLRPGRYSGADLQALLYNAHLEAIHAEIDDRKTLEKNLTLIKQGFSSKKTIKDEKEEKSSIQNKKVIITDVHMQKSLKITHPSTTPQEYSRLAEIYKEFITGRNGEMPSGISSHEIGQRSTLYSKELEETLKPIDLTRFEEFDVLCAKNC
ncbi:7006_t:CDS:10 [Diversispora eburnea]|uniref:Peroxisomal ATPase PEX1 n=1 Tax=Diversispora eburnea TaxID=1213867 RepID=A0A9N8UY05_9GLOM|nr:7006_t:CDS:10 [Diversispora eburnea]